MLFDILALISVLIVILLLGRMVNIFPSLMACTLRWKESVNLEASVKHSLDRDLFAVAMILPFCLTVERFGLYAPRFMDSFGAGLHLTAIIGIFLIYILIRTLVSKMIRPHKMQPKTYRTGVRSSFTFFIILTIILLAMGGVMSFLDVEESMIRSAMLCVSALIYALFILRKLQIFASGCSFFTAFLYLCALEILPTGVLVTSAIIF
ncbi:MAG: DUF4271 domain-containing protein [Bacteroidales bacterium]|nr:DUF4271 domain-containing protein [Bacteroidales bacterium]